VTPPSGTTPKKALSFIFRCPSADPKRGAVKTLLYCRAGSPLNLVFLQKRRYLKTFPWAWTSFPVEPKNGIAGMAKGALYGPGIAEVHETPNILEILVCDPLL
jgi:hypothetical protein